MLQSFKVKFVFAAKIKGRIRWSRKVLRSNSFASLSFKVKFVGAAKFLGHIRWYRKV